MRLLLISIGLVFILVACSGAKSDSDTQPLDISPEEQEIFRSSEPDTVQIGHDSTEYEITIIDPGFYSWVNSIAHPRGYYSQSFMETRNRVYVTHWNIRVQQPTIYSADLYTFPIDYNPSINYGYEVNYMLYNYFLYFQRKYNQRLGPFYPRIN